MTPVTVAVAPVPVPVVMVIRVIKCIDYDNYSILWVFFYILLQSSTAVVSVQYLRPHSIKVVAVAVAPVAVRTRGKVGRSKESSKTRSQ